MLIIYSRINIKLMYTTTAKQKFVDTPRNKSEVIKILFWYRYNSLESENEELSKTCKHKCQIGTIKDLEPIEDYHAVIFNAKYLNTNYILPEKRRLDQLYVFFSIISPYEIKFPHFIKNNFFNLTMTYRLDSDIQIPHKIIKKHPTNYKLPSEAEIKKRTNLIGWVTKNSVVDLPIRTLKFVAELSKYGKAPIINETYKNYSDIVKNYKFYLAIEKHNCDGYLTDELYDLMQYDIVPIVYGLTDYQKLLPPKSFINANDFPNVKSLVLYLMNVTRYTEKYLQYLEWKKDYVLQDPDGSALCKLCSVAKSVRKNEAKVYKNIENWFYQSCIE